MKRFSGHRPAFFRSDIPVRCEHCARSLSGEEGTVCSLGRSLSETGKCRKFHYDPLKRTPQNLPPLRKYNPEDFQL